jgi:hypothetical protein
MATTTLDSTAIQYGTNKFLNLKPKLEIDFCLRKKKIHRSVLCIVEFTDGKSNGKLYNSFPGRL